MIAYIVCSIIFCRTLPVWLRTQLYAGQTFTNSAIQAATQSKFTVFNMCNNCLYYVTRQFHLRNWNELVTKVMSLVRDFAKDLNEASKQAMTVTPR